MAGKEPVPAKTRRDQTDAAFDYWQGQVLSRWGPLLRDRALWSSLAVAGFVTWIVRYLPAARLQIEDVAGSVMDYSAIGLGACVTALVLVIGMAPEERIVKWATTYRDGSEFSTYSELVFVMSWAAITQLASTIVAWASKFLGGSIHLMPKDASSAHLVEFFLATTVVSYALWHLFTVIATLSMVAAVTIQAAQQRR